MVRHDFAIYIYIELMKSQDEVSGCVNFFVPLLLETYEYGMVLKGAVLFCILKELCG